MRYLKVFEMFDDFKKRHHQSTNDKEIGKVSDYLKDIFSEISDDFHIKFYNTDIRNWRSSSIGINIFKKSPEFKKPDGTDDWSKFKQATFKIDEVMELILTSKSYIESVDGKISKVWLHISNPNDGITLSFDEFLNRYSDLGDLVQINIEYILQ
jgi:hypothetical protein